MKKAIALTLAALIMVSVLCGFLQAADGRGAVECYRNYYSCRGSAFAMDVGWLRMAFFLTACDAGLGRCIVLG